MKLEKLQMVNRLDAARSHLLAQLASGTLRVSINGNDQDMVIVELVRPVVEAELRSRLREIEDDMTALGVVVS